MCCCIWQWNSVSPGWSAVKSTTARPKYGTTTVSLMNPAGLLVVHSIHFPQMAVHVHRVRIVRPVAHHQPISRALLQHEFALVRIGLAVHQPHVELSRAARHLLKYQIDVCWGSGEPGVCAAKDRVVPRDAWRIDPLAAAGAGRRTPPRRPVPIREPAFPSRPESICRDWFISTSTSIRSPAPRNIESSRLRA